MTNSSAYSSGHADSGRDTVGVVYTALRAFGMVTLLLMLASIAYSAWIAIGNWDSIRV